MYTGETNEKASTWAKEEGFDADIDPRGGEQTGCESQGIRNQQERVDRTDSEGRSFVCLGATATGGMIDHLIEDYSSQVDQKQCEIERLSADITRYLEEIKKLNFRIQELTSLREELHQQIKENA